MVAALSLAVFDFDGTLIEGDAGVHFARHMLLQGYLREAAEGSILSRIAGLTRMNWRTARLLYKNVALRTRYEQGGIARREMVEEAYASFEGLDRDVIEPELQRFARSRLPNKLREDSLHRLREHRERGDHVVVLSTGLQELIWPLRDQLGDVEVVACRLMDEQGVLTGAVEGPLNGAEKATRLVAIARRGDYALADAYAYADHESDAEMLEVVGNPVVVHPTERMRRLARKQGWSVMDETPTGAP